MQYSLLIKSLFMVTFVTALFLGYTFGVTMEMETEWNPQNGTFKLYNGNLHYSEKDSQGTMYGCDVVFMDGLNNDNVIEGLEHVGNSYFRMNSKIYFVNTANVFSQGEHNKCEAYEVEGAQVEGFSSLNFINRGFNDNTGYVTLDQYSYAHDGKNFFRGSRVMNGPPFESLNYIAYPVFGGIKNLDRLEQLSSEKNSLLIFTDGEFVYDEKGWIITFSNLSKQERLARGIYGKKEQERFSLNGKEVRVYGENYIGDNDFIIYYLPGGTRDILDGVDPNTFEILQGDYARDKGSIFYKNYTIKGVDYETFKSYDDGTAEDKNNIYKGNIVTPKKDLKAIREMKSRLLGEWYTTQITQTIDGKNTDIDSHFDITFNDDNSFDGGGSCNHHSKPYWDLPKKDHLEIGLGFSTKMGCPGVSVENMVGINYIEFIDEDEFIFYYGRAAGESPVTGEIVFHRVLLDSINDNEEPGSDNIFICIAGWIRSTISKLFRGR